MGYHILGDFTPKLDVAPTSIPLKTNAAMMPELKTELLLAKPQLDVVPMQAKLDVTAMEKMPDPVTYAPAKVDVYYEPVQAKVDPYYEPAPAKVDVYYEPAPTKPLPYVEPVKPSYVERFVEPTPVTERDAAISTLYAAKEPEQPAVRNIDPWTSVTTVEPDIYKAAPEIIAYTPTEKEPVMEKINPMLVQSSAVPKEQSDPDAAIKTLYARDAEVKDPFQPTDPKESSDSGAVIETLYARDEQVKDPFSARTITGGPQPSKSDPVLVETPEGEKIDATDTGDGDLTLAENGDWVDPGMVDYGVPFPTDDGTPPVEKAEGGFKWWWAAVGAGVIGAGAGLWFLLGKKRRKNGRKG
jgi:hypothetical protein